MTRSVSSAPDHRLRVALVSLGFGEYSHHLAAGLADHADVLLVVDEADSRQFGRLVDDRVTVWAHPLPRLRQPVGQLRFLLRLLRTLRRFRPDVVHVQQGHLWLNLALPLLRHWPLVMTIHDPRIHLGDASSAKTPQWLYNMGFRRAHMAIVHVPQLMGPVADVGVPADSIRVVPHVAIGDADLEVTAQEEPHMILWYGRIWPYKGLDVLIGAQPKVTAQIPDARFVIAGQGEDLAPYLAQMADRSRFEIHNRFIPVELAAELFHRAAIVTLPYREATQSGVVVTAYAYGKPVVASAVGGLSDQVDDGVTGLLVPAEDENALADALIRLLADDERRVTMGAAGRHKLETEWSPGEVGGRTVDVYRELLSRNGKQRR